MEDSPLRLEHGTQYLKRLGKSGTVVVWETMDRLVSGTAVENNRDRDIFNDRIAIVQKHLAVTFHRFLERTGGVTFQNQL